MVENHGGKREGAGRKPSPNSKSVPRSIRVTKEVSDYLDTTGTGIVETTIRKTADFRKWAKERKSAGLGQHLVQQPNRPNQKS